jgi:hypothetical protein
LQKDVLPTDKSPITTNFNWIGLLTLSILKIKKLDKSKSILVVVGLSPSKIIDAKEIKPLQMSVNNNEVNKMNLEVEPI